MKHAVAILFLTAAIAEAQQPPRELQPIPALFPAGETSLADILAALKQTGNVVTDRRQPAKPVQLTLPMKMGDFWPTLDTVGEKTGIAFSAYQPDGGVALVDRPYRQLPTSYSGVFRFAVKRVNVTRNDETQTRLCTVTLDVAWEPRFQPFYLNLAGASAKFAPDTKGNSLNESIPRQARGSVAGATATEIELSMKAPERSSPALAALTGSIEVVGPPRMLDFAFTKLAPIKKDAQVLKQDGVEVRLVYAELGKTRWSVDLDLADPDGVRMLESFQADAWRANNRIWLSWGEHQLEPTGGYAEKSKVGTRIRAIFEAKGDTPLPPRGAEVTLRYRTPNRVAAFVAPFAFRDLPLP